MSLHHSASLKKNKHWVHTLKLKPFSANECLLCIYKRTAQIKYRRDLKIAIKVYPSKVLGSFRLIPSTPSVKRQTKM